MSSTRIPDAASVTPFPSGPPGIISGRSTTGAPESPERPSRTRKGARVSRRVERSSRPEEERFNIGAPRNTSGARTSTRRLRRDRPVLSDCNDAVPNYPPPSFQEAMESSPALLICPSTLTLVSTTLASPVATLIPSHLPHNMSSIPHQSVATSRWAPPDVNNTDPESNSDSDDSLLIIEGGSVPPDHGLPTGPELDARVREDYRNRHGVEFPGAPPNDQQQTKAHFEARGRSQQRPPPLDLTKAFDGPDKPRSPTLSTPTSPKRRFLSLSPLRTMFPSKAPNPADRPQTAHPTPGVSPYMQSPKGSTFFRSTTSLAAASFLKLPLSSSTNKDKPEKRRFFSKNKDKDRVKEIQSQEAFDIWEEVSTADMSTSEVSTSDVHETQPASLMSMVAACQCTSPPPTSASPTRSVSFTYGALPAEASRPLRASLILPSQSQALGSTTSLAVLQPQPSPQSPPPQQDASPPPPPPPPPPQNPANSVHPLSLLDRKVPFVQRPVKRSHVPTRPRIQVPIPVPLDPVVTTVRTRLPQNAPQPPPAVHSIIPRNSVTAHVARPSPLSLDSFSSPPPEAPLDSSFWQAVDTPLPSTPVKAAHPVPSSPVTPSGPLPQAQPPVSAARSPTPVPVSAGKPPESGVSTLVRWTPPLLEQAGVFSRAPSPFVEEPLTPTRHHYSGRPLPRPPGKQARNHIDSTFAPNEGYAETPFSSTLPPCPEGLLIDLDGDLEEVKSEPDSPAFGADLLDLSSTSEATSITPVNVLAPTPISPASSDINFNPSSCSTPPPSSRRGDRRMESNLRPVFSELTDLDLLASRIAEDEDRTRNGSNYDVSSSPVPPSPEASRSQGQRGSAGEAPSTKQIQRLSTQSNEGLTSGSGIYGTWESPSTVQHHHQHPIQHHLPSRISWRTPGSPNISASNLILSSQAAKHDVEEEDDSSNIYTNSTIEGLPTAPPSHNLLDSSPYQYHAPYRQWQWQHLPARVY